MAFFDKLSEMAKNVSDMASDGLEINKLTSDINLAKGNIDFYKREIGEYYWAKFAMGERLEEEPALICDKIVVTQEKIRELEAKITQMKAEREAEKAERKAARAAEEAAAKAEAAAAAAPAKEEVVAIPVCADCGAVLAEGQKFCGSCGKPVA